VAGTKLLIPQKRILLEKPPVAPLVKKVPFMETA
jgi:hypothetical protein